MAPNKNPAKNGYSTITNAWYSAVKSMRLFNMYCADSSTAAVSTSKMHKTRYRLCPFFQATRDSNAPKRMSVLYVILYVDNGIKHFDS